MVAADLGLSRLPLQASPVQGESVVSQAHSYPSEGLEGRVEFEGEVGMDGWVHLGLGVEVMVHSWLGMEGRVEFEGEVGMDGWVHLGLGVERRVHLQLGVDECVYLQVGVERRVHLQLGVEGWVHSQLGVEERVHLQLAVEERVHLQLAVEERVQVVEWGRLWRCEWERMEARLVLLATG